MSKLKDLLMMAVEKEQFKIGDKTFQIIEVVEAEQPQPDEVKKILVPKEIKILDWAGLLGIGFGEDQFLYHLKGSHSYSVAPIDISTPIQCELIKCERAELVKGDLAFRTNSNDGEFNSQGQYCVIINEDEYCYIERDKDVAIGMSKPRHWYKLQPIEQ